MPTSPYASFTRSSLVAISAMSLVACDSQVTIGHFSCPDVPAASSPEDQGATIWNLVAPWSTGFETGFCDYQNGGFCYQHGAASWEPVTTPVHSGNYAAAFTITADGEDTGNHARCVRTGTLPDEAYYGAYYYIPTPVTIVNILNLFHFQGGADDTARLHALWDVSAISDDAGELQLLVWDYLTDQSHDLVDAPRLPIGRWFHLVVYLKRSRDENGVLAVFLDGSKVLELTKVVTDDSDYAQWYVGAWATELVPANLTLYVDDVTVETPD